jgi:hypothetical protein
MGTVPVGDRHAHLPAVGTPPLPVKDKAVTGQAAEARKVVRHRGFHISLESQLTDGGEVFSLTRRLPVTLPGRFLVLISGIG